MDIEGIKKNIMDFLRNEGYAPSFDDDGDIKFKKEGDLYYVLVDEKQSSPFYLTIALSRNMPKDYDMNKAMTLAFEIEDYKSIKMKLYSWGIQTRAEMFFQNNNHFNDVFNRTTQIMLFAMNEFCEKFFE